MTGNARDVLQALQAMGKQAVTGKGGYHVRGEGFVSLAQARRLTGIEAPRRGERGVMLPWGEYATIAAFSRPRRKA